MTEIKLEITSSDWYYLLEDAYRSANTFLSEARTKLQEMGFENPTVEQLVAVAQLSVASFDSTCKTVGAQNVTKALGDIAESLSFIAEAMSIGTMAAEESARKVIQAAAPGIVRAACDEADRRARRRVA